MQRYWKLVAAGLLLLCVAAGPHHPASPELRTVETAAEVVRAFAAIPLRGIPPAMLHDAVGVAVIPRVVKAGLLIGGRFGRGVVLARGPNGGWAEPVFVTLSGGSFGGQIGIEATDLVLVFKTRQGLDRALKGQLTLGGDVAVAAGPLGREAEAGHTTPGQFRADVLSWSRSRGLFAGVSLEGARLHLEGHANDQFNRGRGPVEAAAVDSLRRELVKLSTPPPVPPRRSGWRW
jgi:lipid-binding SYLF domain-containing protein